MEFRNFTPFPGLAYQSLDQHGGRYHSVALRQTVTIADDGSLTYPDEQEPLVVADEYFGEINQSSVKWESDLAPYKPKCDVIVVASAFAPDGRPARQFAVNLKISTPPGPRISPSVGTGAPRQPSRTIVDKTLSVTGHRFWVRSRLSDWELTSPEPIVSLPLRYEYAYGGELKLPNVRGQREALLKGADPQSVVPLRHAVAETNLVGKGYVEDWFLDTQPFGPIAAPQIEDPSNPIRDLRLAHPTQGFGAITRAWLPRRKLCGTVDDTLGKNDRWLPEDFDFAYWNCAHPDLQVPYLQGDELVELTNLTPGGYLRFTLPGHRLYALVRYESGEIAPAPLNLDTVIVETERMQVSLVHRLLIPLEPQIRVLEAGLITQTQWDAALGLSPVAEAQIG